MRRSLFCLLLVLLLPQSVWAEYFLRGRVIDIDRRKGRITLVQLPCAACQPGDSFSEEVPHLSPEQGKDKKKYTIFIISADFIPPCALPDHIIQVWGEKSREDEHYIRASRITGPGWRHGRDSTGVRSRLRKRCLLQPFSPEAGSQ